MNNEKTRFSGRIRILRELLQQVDAGAKELWFSRLFCSLCDMRKRKEQRLPTRPKSYGHARWGWAIRNDPERADIRKSILLALDDAEQGHRRILNRSYNERMLDASLAWARNDGEREKILNAFDELEETFKN